MSVSSHAPLMTCARFMTCAGDMPPLQNRPHEPRSHGALDGRYGLRRGGAYFVGSADQCSDSSATTMSVGSGAWGSRRFGSAWLQLARFTTCADCDTGPPASVGSRMLSPLPSRKNVCSPNKLLSCRTTG